MYDETPFTEYIEKQQLVKLIDNIKKHKEENTILNFQILDIIDRVFFVKIEGLTKIFKHSAGLIWVIEDDPYAKTFSTLNKSKALKLYSIFQNWLDKLASDKNKAQPLPLQ